jgi:hypothetical protein
MHCLNMSDWGFAGSVAEAACVFRGICLKIKPTCAKDVLRMRCVSWGKGGERYQIASLPITCALVMHGVGPHDDIA